MISRCSTKRAYVFVKCLSLVFLERIPSTGAASCFHSTRLRRTMRIWFSMKYVVGAILCVCGVDNMALPEELVQSLELRAELFRVVPDALGVDLAHLDVDLTHVVLGLAEIAGCAHMVEHGPHEQLGQVPL